MMTHRSKKPFECKFDGCDKSYCDARSLRRHLENHHMQTLNDPSAAPDNAAYSRANGGGGSGGDYFQFDPAYRCAVQSYLDVPSHKLTGSEE